MILFAIKQKSSLLRVVKKMFILVAKFSSAFCCLTCYLTRIEVFLFVHANNAVTTDDEEDSN